VPAATVVEMVATSVLGSLAVAMTVWVASARSSRTSRFPPLVSAALCHGLTVIETAPAPQVNETTSTSVVLPMMPDAESDGVVSAVAVASVSP
jgi:hypothetical protein